MYSLQIAARVLENQGEIRVEKVVPERVVTGRCGGGECMGKAQEGYVISWLHTSLDVIVMYTFIRVAFDVQREVHRLCLSSELGSNFWEVSAI